MANENQFSRLKVAQLPPERLASLYAKAHDQMRAIDGLQPTEAFDELMKYLFLREQAVATAGDVHAAPSDLTDIDLEIVSTADGLRDRLADAVGTTRSASVSAWSDHKFRLSDAALSAIHNILGRVPLSRLPYDIRSTALRTFLTPELRRGLGVYLTPDSVARLAVSLIAPPPGSTVFDPACGSGTFLIELLDYWRQGNVPQTPLKAWGTDINPRMLQLADLNLGHDPQVSFTSALLDAFTTNLAAPTTWPTGGPADFILTNPPFGVTLDNSFTDLRSFETCRRDDGWVRERMPSEVVLTEVCLRMLKPGGRLAIIVPRSLVTNSTLKDARSALDRFGTVECIVALPSETFSTTGTLTTTFLMLVRRRSSSDNEPVRVRYAELNNIGVDATGRPRDGSQLPALSDMNNSLWRLLEPVPSTETFSRLSYLMDRRVHVARPTSSQVALGDLASAITVGRTPARNSYTSAGMFILKVGNLTGRGISWVPRERNFIAGRDADRRRENPVLQLQRDDILLTSSAHARRYIAAKVDILDAIPAQISSGVTFVGELLLVRVRKGGIDPFRLLAFLRLNDTGEALRHLARGQTAHLSPGDVANLPVPKELLDPGHPLSKVADLLREQTVRWRAFDEISRVVDSQLASIGEYLSDAG